MIRSISNVPVLTRKDALEIIPNKLYFLVTGPFDNLSALHSTSLLLNIDSELVYEPFFADFGPLNLGCTYRFCQKINTLLKRGEATNRPVFYCAGDQSHCKANGTVLIGIWQILFGGCTATQAYSRLKTLEPFAPFRDASCGTPTFHLSVLDCLRGVEKAQMVGFLDWNRPDSKFNVAKYEFYEQVNNGDWNWIVPGKLLAVSGPSARRVENYGYRMLSCQDYWETFHKEGVTTVVRLNKKQYDRRRFTEGGFAHYDMYFPDGSCPPRAILDQFLKLAEEEPGALAVHCKAGLGRTGSLICCYMMKHYGFTAEESIGYIRLCRPGSILGPQQNWLRDMQRTMWVEGGIGSLRRAPSGQPDLESTPYNSFNSPVKDARSGTHGRNLSSSGPPPLRTQSDNRGNRCNTPAAGLATPAAAASLERAISNIDIGRSMDKRMPPRPAIFSNIFRRPATGSQPSSLHATTHTDAVNQPTRPATQGYSERRSEGQNSSSPRASTSHRRIRSGSLQTNPAPPSTAPSSLFVGNSRLLPYKTPTPAAGLPTSLSNSYRSESPLASNSAQGPRVIRTLAPNGQPRKVIM